MGYPFKGAPFCRPLFSLAAKLPKRYFRGNAISNSAPLPILVLTYWHRCREVLGHNFVMWIPHFREKVRFQIIQIGWHEYEVKSQLFFAGIDRAENKFLYTITATWYNTNYGVTSPAVGGSVFALERGLAYGEYNLPDYYSGSYWKNLTYWQ